MTPFTYPLPTEYRDPATVYPAHWRERPIEGDRVIPLGFDWGVTTSFHVNVQYLSTQPFNQIVAAFVDNIKNDVDVQFYFPDTNFILTVPAGSSGLYPITTNGKDFYAISLGAVSGNITRMQVYNSYPHPVAIHKTEFVTPALAASVNLVAGTTALVAAGINGILAAAQLIVNNVTGGAASGTTNITLQDGNLKNIAVTGFSENAAGYTASAIVLDLSGVIIPFSNGLNVIQTISGTAFASGTLRINLYTR